MPRVKKRPDLILDDDMPIPNLSADKVTSGVLAKQRGGTGSDLSATGGSGQVLKQKTVGANLVTEKLTFPELDQDSLVALPFSVGTEPSVDIAKGNLFRLKDESFNFKDSSGSKTRLAGKPNGFLGIFAYFPTAANFANATKTNAVKTANPWLKACRWATTGTENICQTADPASNQWDTDIAALTGLSHPFNIVATRLTASPSLANYDVQLAASFTRMDAVIGGICAQMIACGSSDLEFDPENYATSDIAMMFNFGQGTNGIKNVGSVSRATMCLRIEDAGRQFGNSFWSRIPNGKLHMMFAATQVGGWTGSPSGTQAPTSMADAAYDTESSLYNMLPYFCRGLLDACPPTGRILDYCEGGMYVVSGLASMTRVMGYSNNWVSVFFPGDSGLVEKAKTVWKAIPLLYPSYYFKAKGSFYPGGDYTYQIAGAFVTGKTYKIKSVGTTTTWTACGAVTGTLGETFVATNAGSGDGTAYNVTDQKAMFTRNALYALQLTPDGYLPALFVDGADADPWGQYGAVTNIPTVWSDCLNEALAVFQNKQNLTMSNAVLEPLLATYFSARSDFKKERF